MYSPKRPYITSAKRADTRPGAEGKRERTTGVLWRLIKALLVLAVLAALAFVAYAYVGPIFFASDFAAPVQEVVKPVTLDTQ